MHLQCRTIGKNVDWACANVLKHGTIIVSGFGYFHKNLGFLWNKNVSKTIHYTYTSYNKYFRLCMVSEEQRPLPLVVQMHQTVSEKCRVLFLQLIFMYEVLKFPNYSGSKLLVLSLLRHCRYPMESQPSPKSIIFF